MDILIIENDKVIRDQLKVGLQSFPQFSVECATGLPGVNQARLKRYDYILIGVNAQDGESMELIKALREFDRETDVVIVTSHKQARLMATEKNRYNVFAFIDTPVDAQQFFRVVSRFKPRTAVEPHAR